DWVRMLMSSLDGAADLWILELECGDDGEMALTVKMRSASDRARRIWKRRSLLAGRSLNDNYGGDDGTP
ncbi:hypothetical protein ACLOJK_004630, partial [Asimina triloba]